MCSLPYCRFLICLGETYGLLLLTLPLAYLSNFAASHYYRYWYSIRSPEVQGKEIGFCQITISFPLPFPPLSYRTSSGFYNAESNIQNPTSEVEERKNLSIKNPCHVFLYILYYICPYAHRHDIHPLDKSWRRDRPMGHGNPRYDVS